VLFGEAHEVLALDELHRTVRCLRGLPAWLAASTLEAEDLPAPTMRVMSVPLPTKC
jgi:hypothetical protein